jgi:hypothetical protein
VTAPAADPVSSFPKAFETQAHYCRILGSPLYAHLLERAAADIAAGGPVREVLRGHEHDELNTMIPLRLLGAVHRAVLRGDAPRLAACYPSAGGEADPEAAWQAFSETVARLADSLRDDMDAPVQTNEVARSPALLGGFLLVAKQTGLPLRVLEIGASAGLNLLFDRYHYVSAGGSWGEPSSPVRFEDYIEGEPFPWDVALSIKERHGCDRAPLDPASERDALTLRGFVWPDQLERFELLDAALDFARSNPVHVEHAGAAEWVERRLARPSPGVATVVFHSLVMMYLSEEERERTKVAIIAAGERATAETPVAWLSMELGGDEADVRLTVWPSGGERLIAKAGYQGRPIRWLGAP